MGIAQTQRLNLPFMSRFSSSPISCISPQSPAGSMPQLSPVGTSKSQRRAPPRTGRGGAPTIGRAAVGHHGTVRTPIRPRGPTQAIPGHVAATSSRFATAAAVGRSDFVKSLRRIPAGDPTGRRGAPRPTVLPSGAPRGRVRTPIRPRAPTRPIPGPVVAGQAPQIALYRLPAMVSLRYSPPLSTINMHRTTWNWMGRMVNKLSRSPHSPHTCTT